MSGSKDDDWWRGAVIYQIYPRSFQDSDGSGSGDLKGITARLDHVARLGADAIWISPFFRSPMKDMGYDVSDYCDVDPMFGDLADFDALVARAHALGLKVMIDQVLNHTSDQHAWFRESRQDRSNPKADWYVWADPQPDGSAPNNWLSVFGGPAWEWDGVRKQYYLHNFLSTQPDINFHCEAAQQAILDSVRFWLDRGVDGFRLDTANFFFHDAKLRSNPPAGLRDGRPAGIGADAPDINPYGMQSHLYSKSQPENIGFLERFRALLDSYDARASVGEVGDARAIELVAEYTDGRRLHMCYTFDLLSENFSADFLRRTVQRFEDVVTNGWVCWAMSNHDVVRHVTRFTPAGGDPVAVAKLAITLLLCLRGSVCLYQGEELGLTEAEIAFEDLQDPYGKRFWPAFKGRDGSRTPMVWEADAPNAGFSDGKPWLPVPKEHLPLAVDQQTPEGTLAQYKAMLAFRHGEEALRLGDIRFLPAAGEVLAFTRTHANRQILCAFNLGTEAASYPLPAEDGVVAALAAPGATGTLKDGVLTLPPMGFFLGE